MTHLTDPSENCGGRCQVTVEKLCDLVGDAANDDATHAYLSVSMQTWQPPPVATMNCRSRNRWLPPPWTWLPSRCACGYYLARFKDQYLTTRLANLSIQKNSTFYCVFTISPKKKYFTHFALDHFSSLVFSLFFCCIVVFGCCISPLCFICSLQSLWPSLAVRLGLEIFIQL